MGRRLLATPHPCLETTGFRPFDLDGATLPVFTDQKLQWPRDPEIYKGPLLLVKLGRGEGGLEAAMVEGNLVYSQRYYGLPAVEAHRQWLLCLLGILNSALATYFVFLTGAEWGVERDNINVADLYRLPVPSTNAKTGEKTSKAQGVAKLVVTFRKAVQRGRTISESDRRCLDTAVFDLYDLSREQRALVEDMVRSTVDLHRRAEASAAVKPPQLDELEDYAACFQGVVNGFLSVRDASRTVAEIFEVPADSPLRVVKFRTVAREAAETPVRRVAVPGLAQVLDEMARNLPHEVAEQIYVRRHLRLYAPGEVYIVKPAERRYWTRSAGLNDADSVLAEHMRAE